MITYGNTGGASNPYNFPNPAPGMSAPIPNEAIYQMGCDDDTYEQLEEIAETNGMTNQEESQEESQEENAGENSIVDY